MGLWRSIRKNAALLTVSSLVMQSLSMLWQVWLAAHIGAAGIGLFQLIGSVGFLFITLAVSASGFPSRGCSPRSWDNAAAGACAP